MKIVGLADIHGDVANIEKISGELSNADVVLLIGDVTNFGRDGETRNVINALQKTAPRILAVHGNCDYPEVEQTLEADGLNIHGKGVVIDGVGFVGLGGSLITPFGTPGEYTEDTLHHCLKQAVSGLPAGMPIVFASHQPPINTATDALKSGEHVGSQSVRQFIEKYQPMICFTGHIHEARAMDDIERTKIVNPGPLWNGWYAYAEINDQVEQCIIKKIDS